MNKEMKKLLKNICKSKVYSNILKVLRTRLSDDCLIWELMILDNEFIGDAKANWYVDKFSKRSYYEYKTNLIEKFEDIL